MWCYGILWTLHSWNYLKFQRSSFIISFQLYARILFPSVIWKLFLCTRSPGNWSTIGVCTKCDTICSWNQWYLCSRPFSLKSLYVHNLRILLWLSQSAYNRTLTICIYLNTDCNSPSTSYLSGPQTVVFPFLWEKNHMLTLCSFVDLTPSSHSLSQ